MVEAEGSTAAESFSDLLAECLSWPAVALDDELRRLEIERRRIEARMAAVVTAAERTAAYTVDGHRSSNAHLRATTNCSGASARRLRRRARITAEVAGVGDAWSAGHIGGDQVDALARRHANPRCGHDLADSAPTLLDHAEHLEFDDFELVLQRWELFADPDGSFDEAEAAARDRDVHVAAGDLGLDISGFGGDALDAVKMRRIFDQFVGAEFHSDTDACDHPDDPLPRTAGQRRFDALRELFFAANAAAAAGLAPVAPAVNVDILFDSRSFGEALHAHGLAGSDNPFQLSPSTLLERRCSTSDGVGIQPDAALAAALDGHVRRVVIDANSVVIDQGTRQRLFTGAAREAAVMLATACYHPGCRVAAHHCEIDHLTPALDGGPTDQHNAGVACGFHNRQRHRRRFGARRASTGRVYPLRPDGTPLLAAGERPPAWADD
ncbi:MAG: DUF222 domain-containing protein [Actinomycetota bacterium]